MEYDKSFQSGSVESGATGQVTAAAIPTHTVTVTNTTVDEVANPSTFAATLTSKDGKDTKYTATVEAKVATFAEVPEGNYTLEVKDTGDANEGAFSAVYPSGNQEVMVADDDVNLDITFAIRKVHVKSVISYGGQVVKSVDQDYEVVKKNESSLVDTVVEMPLSRYLTEEGTHKVTAELKTNSAPFAKTYTLGKSAKDIDETPDLYQAVSLEEGHEMYFIEGESLSGANTGNLSSSNLSGGTGGRGWSATQNVIKVPKSGKYDVTYAVLSSNYGANKGGTVTIAHNGTQIGEPVNVDYITVSTVATTGTKKVTDVSLLQDEQITFTPTMTTGSLDYLLLEWKEEIPANEVDYKINIVDGDGSEIAGVDPIEGQAIALEDSVTIQGCLPKAVKGSDGKYYVLKDSQENVDGYSVTINKDVEKYETKVTYEVDETIKYYVDVEDITQAKDTQENIAYSKGKSAPFGSKCQISELQEGSYTCVAYVTGRPDRELNLRKTYAKEDTLIQVVKSDSGTGEISADFELDAATSLYLTGSWTSNTPNQGAYVDYIIIKTKQ